MIEMKDTMTRRSFHAAVGASALSAPALLPGQAPPERRRLSSQWPEQKLAAALIPRARWQPFPAASDRAGWEALPASLRGELVAAAETIAPADWPVLPATLFLEYARIGNRANYERVRNIRRDRLATLVLAECAEGKGRFLDGIANGVWITCEETFWGVPAHLGPQKAGNGLPDIQDPVVDLFAAETAALLAWTDYLLGPQLEKVHKLIRPRIAYEIERRLLKPCLERDDWSWMGFHANRAVNNWNPWINSNWLASALLMEADAARRTAAVHKILRSLDRFLDGYHDDGGCDEGPGYWGRAGASLFDNLELLHSASAGRIDFYSMPLVAEIGRYIYRAHIADDWYTNFADASARVRPAGDLVYRYGKRVGDQKMRLLGAWAAFSRGEGHRGTDSTGRTLPALFNYAELRQAPRGQPLVRDVWLPGIQVMAARLREGSADGLYVAAQGGHNAESHNHNDVGNFLVYADGRPAIIDVGVETYSAKTFSSRRYEIWTMQSAYHNLPTIGGVMQAAGREFEARNVAYKAGDAAAEFSLDIAAAYPPEANLASWRRTLRLDRARNEVTVEDRYSLRKAAGEITLTLMTPCQVTAGAGELTLEDKGFRSGAVRIRFDRTALAPKVEEIPIEDARLKAVWGERIRRILLLAAGPPASGAFTVRFTQS